MLIELNQKKDPTPTKTYVRYVHVWAKKRSIEIDMLKDPQGRVTSLSNIMWTTIE